MSLFSDILSSIGGDPVPRPPQPPVKRPASANTNRPGNDLSKPVVSLGINGTASTTGLKRKAEDNLDKQQDRASTKLATPVNGTPKPVYAGTMSKASSSSTAVTQRPKSSEGKPASKPTVPAVAVVPTAASAKAPSKGSYAEIIARAKAAQMERGQNQNQVGMIRHQKEQREKVSYISQRKTGTEESRAKAHSVDRPKNRPVLNGRIEKRPRSNSPLKKSGPSKTDKPRAPKPTYNGTMRIAPSKSRDKPRPARRQDEYLGTDEEDNSELDEDMDEDDYGSDESEDMEAGAFDIDEEEAAAARAAKIEDAKEAALEKKLKAEKEERRKKLEALSKKAPKQKF